LLGPSGSGKSSLLAIAAGLERASGGQALLLGSDVGALDEDRLARLRGRGVGIVLQSFHLLPTMTALENVAVPLELAGLDDPFGRAERELVAVGLENRVPAAGLTVVPLRDVRQRVAVVEIAAEER